MILILEKENEKIYEKINLLEMAVYKTDTAKGSTKFDQIEDRCLDLECKQREIRVEVTDKINNAIKVFDDYMFNLD